MIYIYMYVGDILGYMEIYWENGRENGKYYLGFRV